MLTERLHPLRLFLASGANRDRTGDLLLAKCTRERAAVGRLRVSADSAGPLASLCGVAADQIRAAEASRANQELAAGRELPAKSTTRGSADDRPHAQLAPNQSRQPRPIDPSLLAA